MTRRIAALAAVILMAVAWLCFLKANRESANPETTVKSVAEQDAAVENALATARPDAANAIASNFAAAPPPQNIFYSLPSKPLLAPVGPPQPLEYTNREPAIVLDRLRHAIHDYAAMFGGNPVGLNSEITSQLNGKNSKQANFIDPEAGMRIDEHGELVDPWGSPYFFHQLSAARMEIRSAGPDKILWTADDLVVE